MDEFVEFTCPQCGTEVRVTQVQGDRCTSCRFEFKWFGSGEQRTAEDYFAVLTRRKHFLPLAGAEGYIVAHE